MSQLLISNGIRVSGDYYDVGRMRTISAKMVSFLKFLAIVVILAKVDFEFDLWRTYVARHRIHAVLIVWFVCNWFESSLVSSGAFEVFCKNELIFSKLQTNQIPNSVQLLARIQQCLLGE